MLGQASYVPLLHARIAEIKALRYLSDGAKDRLFPIVAIRPWPRARNLSKSYEKVQEALGSRRFAFELDPTRYLASSTENAPIEFRQLFDPAGGYANYYDAVESVEGAVPVLRLSEPINLAHQLRHVERLDRGVVVRVQMDTAAAGIDALKATLRGTPDVLVVIDAGWTRDLLSRELWASDIVEIVTNIADEPEIAITSSSFPDTFAKIGKRGEHIVLERQLHSALVRRHNEATIVYGDWGSTRPPAIDSSPMRNVPRIDLPTAANWVSFRKVADEEYKEVAERLIEDATWRTDLTTWGTYTISCTAEGLPGAIRSPGTAAAARINIHMHLQAYSGLAEMPSDGEEPFVDI